jgi:hypothetical protein
MAGVDLRVFPNPFENELTIDFNLNKGGDTRFEIYSLTGQLQYKTTVGKVEGYRQLTFSDNSIASLQKGMYVAKLFVDNIPVQSVKVIKR